jgi:hypothetical protein
MFIKGEDRPCAYVLRIKWSSVPHRALEVGKRWVKSSMPF